MFRTDIAQLLLLLFLAFGIRNLNAQTMTDQASTFTNQAGLVRSHKNTIVFMSGATLITCVYQNNTASGCSELAFESRDGIFYEDESGLYFITSGYSIVNIYRIRTVNNTAVSTLFWTTSNKGYPQLYTADVDYQHRWMALGGPSRLFLFDIRDMNNIVNTDSTTYPVTISINVYKRMLSIRRNLVCQVAAGAGFICCPIANGRLTAACTRHDNNVWASSLQVYDDYIISCGTGIRVFNTATRQFRGGVSGNCLDFTRSRNWIVYTDWWNYRNVLVSIANPAAPANLVFTGSPAQPWVIFLNEWGLYYSYWPIRQLVLGIGESHDEYYRNSDYYGVGPAINPLVFNATTLYEFGPTLERTLNITARDTWLPNDVTISYIVQSVPSDFILEQRLSNGNWSQLRVNSTFSQTQINSAQIRLRVQLQPNPTSRNLSQNFQISITNGRGSFIRLDMQATRLFSGTDCPTNAICNGGSVFVCMSGYTANVTGTDCTTCPYGFFKKFTGNGPCSACPLNYLTCDSTSFLCPAGTVFTEDTNDCTRCQEGYFRSEMTAKECQKCPENAVCGQASFECSSEFLRFNNSSCTACPINSICNGSSLFSCQNGFQLTENGCVSVLKPTMPDQIPSAFQSFLMSNPAVTIVLILLVWAIFSIVGMLIGFTWKARNGQKAARGEIFMAATTPMHQISSNHPLPQISSISRLSAYSQRSTSPSLSRNVSTNSGFTVASHHLRGTIRSSRPQGTVRSPRPQSTYVSAISRS